MQSFQYYIKTDVVFGEGSVCRTAELVKKTAELVEPEVIIVIDSLAARDIKRLSTTIQITDTGISPGAGMGNRRTGIKVQKSSP